LGTARILAVRTLNLPGFIWASFFPRATVGEFELEDPKKLLNLLLKNVGPPACSRQRPGVRMCGRTKTWMCCASGGIFRNWFQYLQSED
jgi:hypothetical protein